MVQVRLAQTWTDTGGAAHRAGDLVDVDAITLAKLEACGVVTPNDSTEPRSGATPDWAGPTGPDTTGPDTTGPDTDIAGPTPDIEELTAEWAGPTDDDE
jgi:hypothetical protein